MSWNTCREGLPNSWLIKADEHEKQMIYCISWGNGTPLQHSFAWKIPWTEVSDIWSWQSTGVLRVGHDWMTSLSRFNFMPWRRTWQPTPVFWKIPWTEEPGRLQSMGSLGVFTFTCHFHALEKAVATQSSVLAWRIPGTGEPDRLPSMGSHRVRYDWSDLAAAAAAKFRMWCYIQCVAFYSNIK